MGTDGYIFCFIFFIQGFNPNTGQLIKQEELRSEAPCALNADVNITCGNNEIIAVQSLYFYYHGDCEGGCCSYDSSHFSSGADDNFARTVRRTCSGENTCNLGRLDDVRDFGAAGSKRPSYAVIKYYCIPASRTTTICSSEKLTSIGKPLYLTNENYPSVTTGDSTCSCSLEVPSCTSSINLYIIDADMYYDTETCEQNIQFVDGTDETLKQIDCSDYYENQIPKTNFDTNYVKIDFNDNSVENQEGYFFFGFEVSENVTFKLSCSYEAQSICRDCGVPSPIPHGTFTVDDTDYGAEADVVCNNGYESESTSVSCLETGKWENATCSPENCGAPYTIDNGTITPVISDITTFGARANVVCDEGFEMKGNCESDEFQCGDGTCIDNESKCDSVPDCVYELDELLCPDQTSCIEGQVLCGTSCINTEDTCEDSGSTETVASNGTISCLVIGKWEIVKCSPKDCGDPAVIANGQITLPVDGMTTYKSTAGVMCDTGFVASTDTVSCQANGSWEVVRCIVYCGPPKNATGANVTTSNGYIENSVATYECKTGYTQTSGDLQRTCGSDNTWSGTLPTCTPDCGAPDNVTRATVTTSNDNLENSVATYVCEQGYVHTSGSLTRTCGSDSTWSGTLPTCTPDCGAPDNVTGVTVTTSNDNLENSVATYVCEQGYTHTSGSLTRTCESDSTWSGTLPICTPDCGAPDNVTGATVTTSNDNLKNSVATYVCRQGYTHTSGSLTRTCGSDSTWSGIMPTCTPDCGAPDNVTGATVTTSNDNLENSVATYVCEQGYTHTSGSLTRTCESDSTWSGTLPTCTPDCGPTDNVTGATVTTSNDNLENSVATYVCRQGYTHTSGSLTRTCGSDSTWSGTLPTCTPDCGAPDNVTGATVTTSNDNLENSVATYVCEQGYTHTSGTLTRTCESDSTWSGTFPTCTPDCGAPDNVTGATVTTSNDNLENSVATYECRQGYTHTSGSLTRTCGSDSTWSGTLPTCTPDCGAPDNVTGATVTASNDNLENSIATYMCEQGYTHTSGSLTRTCESDSTWSGTLPTCTPDCGAPDNVTGATVTTSNDNLENSVATYVCRQGYTHTSGSLTRTCGSDSTWSGTLPTCTPDCGAPDNVTGATVTTSNDNLENSVATYVCRQGYTHTSGSLTRTCGSDSTWSGTLPTCTPDCGAPDNVTGATVTTSNDNLENSVATYVCRQGYTHTSGSLTRTCGSDSTWSGTLPTCTPDCGAPDNVTGATVTTSNDNLENSVATYVCEQEYTHTSGSLTRTCESDSTWSGTLPTCTPDCGAPDNVTGATVTTSNDNLENSVATYVCEQGYTHTSGSLTRTCESDSTWSGTLPTCTPDCGAPDNVTGATVTTSNDNLENSVATYVCEQGYTHTSGSLARTCGSDSTWSGTLPTCTPDCGAPDNVTGATVTASNDNLENSVATYVCEQGYTHTSGTLTRTCESDSTWSGTLPTCTPDCGAPDNVTGATVTTSNDNLENSVATYVCRQGYTHTSGSLARTCGSDSTWSGTLPTCMPDCGALDNVTGATVTTSNDNLENSVATYVCEQGYTHTSGTLTRTCESDSTWSGTLPTCTPDCGAPDNVTGATVTTSNDNLENSVATYVCRQGYTHTSGSLARTCGSDSTWSGTLPTCTPDCGAPNDVTGATVTTSNDNLENSVATYVCEQGYTHTSGTLTRTCESDSTWSGTLPTCTPDCGPPENVTGATITTSNDNLENSVATYMCKQGYTHTSGSLTQTCESDSTWSGSLPTCTPDCGTPNPLANGTIDVDGNTTYPSTASVTCVSGFHPTTDTIRCQANGTWETVYCVITDCGKPPSIVNGNTILNKEKETSFVSTATVNCDPGYTATPLIISCLDDGSWENSTCKIKDCGPTYEIDNGTVSIDPPGTTTYLATATVSCEKGFSALANSISCQETGSWQNASCVIRDCEDPSAIENGTIYVDVPGKTTYLSTATVSCQPGFNESKTSISCQANGTWEDAACVIKDCGVPSGIEKGNITVDVPGETTYLSTATVSCQPGFNKSAKTVSCQANGTWQDVACVIKDCGIPKAINNGTIKVNVSGKTTYLSTATVSCQDGFNESVVMISCQASGVWEDASCLINDCGDPNSIHNGTITVDVSGKTTYLSKATVSCQPGFTESAKHVTCQASGAWEDASCLLKDCEEPSAIKNGTISVDVPGKTTYLSTATVSCQPGFNGSATTISCQASGAWEDISCIIIECGVPKTIHNGTITVDVTGKTTYLSTATVSCQPGFDESAAIISCQASGAWEDATCLIKDCGVPNSIHNGTINVDVPGKTTYLSTATVSCQPGFKESAVTVSCQASGAWEDASCVIKDCEVPSAIENGNITVDVPGKTTYLSTATVSCQPGFNRSATTISCQATGSWENASCDIKDCGAPNVIHNGTITVDVTGKTTYLSTATVSCQPGFTESTTVISCQASGAWEVASCVVKDCGIPSPLANGTIDLEGKTTYPSTASVTCVTGFQPTTDTIRCQASGTWETVYCVITDCGKPRSIANGNIILNKEKETTFVSTATINCDPGYTATSLIISCLDDGSWENSTCKIKDCGPTNKIDNGTIAVDPPGTTTYLATATVSCEEGFSALANPISCQETGLWQDASCVIKDCEDPSAIENGTISVDVPGKTTYLSTATVSCQPGFNKSKTSVSCQANGTWEDVACAIKDCEDPSAIENGIITVDVPGKTTYLSKATVSCQPGFNGSATTISCQASGVWEDAICVIKDCGAPNSINNGTVTVDVSGKTTYLSKATVSCQPGFTESAVTVSCQASGAWEDASCAIKDCEVPSAIENGTITVDIPGITTYLSTATVSCQPGFNRSVTTISCQATGTWGNASCDIKDCGGPNLIHNGTITVDVTGKTTYLSTATVSCKPGFTESDTVISCQASGVWEVASCVIKDCGKPPKLEDGKIVLDEENRTTFGSAAVIECQTGFIPSSVAVVCQENGKWQDASCVIKAVDCGLPPALANGQITLATTGNTQFGATATVSCRKGYTKSLSSILCLNTGKWQLVSCDIIDCGDPPNIRHGAVNVLEGSYTTYDSVAYVTCHEGYYTEQPFVACEEIGTWESTTCKPEDDDDVTFIILVATGGAVLLIALIILITLIVLSKSRRRSANLHHERRGGHYPYYRNNLNNLNGDAFHGDIQDEEFPEDIGNLEGSPTENGGNRFRHELELAEHEHIMLPNDLDYLEENVFRSHEPHMWHADMHRHTEGSEYDGGVSMYRF